MIPQDCPRFGFHNLRQGLSTFLFDNGQDPVVVRRMLRQKHMDMTMHYVYNSRKARNAPGQFIERFLPSGTTPSGGRRISKSGTECGLPQRVEVDFL